MNHLDTAALCARQGICFKPLVAENSGAWDGETTKFLRHVSHAVAVRTGQDVSQTHSKLLQKLSVVARSHRARAVQLRELSEQPGAPSAFEGQAGFAWPCGNHARMWLSGITLFVPLEEITSKDLLIARWERRCEWLETSAQR